MGVEPGTYYVRVYGDFAGNSYDLIVESLEVTTVTRSLDQR